METSTSLLHPEEAVFEAVRFLVPSRRVPKIARPPLGSTTGER